MNITVTYGAGFEVEKPKTMRQKVEGIEALMSAMPNVDLPVINHFSKGVYARELHIPAGTVLTGKIHKFDNFNILSKGEISVLTENGVERVSAPFSIVSPAGTKRIAYAHTDCIWTTIHGTELTDLESIETEFVVGTDAGYLAFCESLKIKGE